MFRARKNFNLNRKIAVLLCTAFISFPFFSQDFGQGNEYGHEHGHELTPEEFEAKMNEYMDSLDRLFEEGRHLEVEINKQLEGLKYES